jgi:urease subunit beta
VRFEPGVEREVTLVPLAGARIVPGLRVEFAGPLDERGPEPGPLTYGGEA